MVTLWPVSTVPASVDMFACPAASSQKCDAVAFACAEAVSAVVCALLAAVLAASAISAASAAPCFASAATFALSATAADMELMRSDAFSIWFDA